MSKPSATNPFPSPSPLEAVLLQELTKVAAECYIRGWCPGTAGNFSLLGQRGICWVSPSGIDKNKLAVGTFVPVGVATGCAVDPSASQASLEIAVHLAIYRQFGNARAVVHAHPPHLVRRSKSGEALRFCGAEMQKALGSETHLDELELPVLANRTPKMFDRIADDISGLIDGTSRLIILAGHGVYAWAETPLRALGYIEALEFLCQTQS